ncbi:MAG TPA: mechanosensitive ion channel family protein, partial [Xanthobacteraceae bacterium]|nr:mechanosensitive ion channel family protein [Xanthobacteraceae bacterium]
MERQIMETTAESIAATPTALAQLGTLAIHYGLSLAGALVLLVGGWILSGFVSRWAYKGLSRIHGIDETLARFFENVLHYGLLIL